jgi:alkanesulfonate monooxygenase SsuD/methylene tetrahydromethanopterin reductase-like flavin-dependent oxidoreductase (luciferase family)
VTTYGHALRFGVEVVGGGADAPGAAVALAVLAEQLGYDFVAYPDEPGLAEPGADAITLAAWTAAQTTKVQVLASRLDPMARPASVVARGAASLQLLSGGRAMLAFGSGTASRELDAVDEAVSVVRALRHPGLGPASSPGSRHNVADAEPGPALERDVPLWLHGSDTAVAALAGRIAEGWSMDLDETGA